MMLENLVRAFETGKRLPRRDITHRLRPSVSHGGIVTLLQTLLAGYGETQRSVYCTDAHRTYTIRPATEWDSKALYGVCAKLQYAHGEWGKKL